MRVVFHRQALALFMLLALACDAGSDPPVPSSRQPPPPPKPRPAPAASWSDDGMRPKLEFDGSRGDYSASINGSFGQLIVSVRGSDVPSQTVLRFKDQTAKLDNGYGSLDVTLDYPLGAVELKDVSDYQRKVDIGFEFQVELPGHEPATVKLPPLSLRSAASSSFAEVAKGRVEFVGEPADDGVRDIVVQINSVHSIEEVVGPAKLLQDIDLVSIEEQVPTDQRKLCKGYTGGDINFTIEHTSIRVYDRRTSELAAETTLVPSNRCPSVAMATDGEASHYVGQEAKLEWLRSVVEKPNKRNK